MTETVIVVLVVAAAAGYLLVAGARFFRGQSGCGSSCHCGGTEDRANDDRFGVRRELFNVGMDRRDS